MKKLFGYLLLFILANCKEPDLTYSFPPRVTNQSILKAFCQLLADKQYASISGLDMPEEQLKNFVFLKLNDKDFAELNDASCEPIPTSVTENGNLMSFRPAVCTYEQVSYYDNGLIGFSEKVYVAIAESGSGDRIVFSFLHGIPQDGTYDLNSSNVVSAAFLKCPGCSGNSCFCTYMPLSDGQLTVTTDHVLMFYYEGYDKQAFSFKAGCCLQ